MATLTSYTAVKTVILVKLVVDQYRANSTDSFTTADFTFTDSDTAITFGSDTYTPLGEFINVTATTSELRPSSDQVTVTISGVPTGNITDVIYSRTKGSKIEIRRQFYTIAGALIDTQGYFFGRVNNWSLQEEFDVEERSATNTMLFECSNQLAVLKEKIAGRLTNPTSNNRFFPNDTGLDRVPIIKGTKIDFGAP